MQAVVLHLSKAGRWQSQTARPLKKQTCNSHLVQLSFVVGAAILELVAAVVCATHALCIAKLAASAWAIAAAVSKGADRAKGHHPRFEHGEAGEAEGLPGGEPGQHPAVGLLLLRRGQSCVMGLQAQGCGGTHGRHALPLQGACAVKAAAFDAHSVSHGAAVAAGHSCHAVKLRGSQQWGSTYMRWVGKREGGRAGGVRESVNSLGLQ